MVATLVLLNAVFRWNCVAMAKIANPLIALNGERHLVTFMFRGEEVMFDPNEVIGIRRGGPKEENVVQLDHRNGCWLIDGTVEGVRQLLRK